MSHRSGRNPSKIMPQALPDRLPDQPGAADFSCGGEHEQHDRICDCHGTIIAGRYSSAEPHASRQFGASSKAQP
jgi:hypothetical protein